jgi:hypothetical protein
VEKFQIVDSINCYTTMDRSISILLLHIHPKTDNRIIFSTIVAAYIKKRDTISKILWKTQVSSNYLVRTLERKLNLDIEITSSLMAWSYLLNILVGKVSCFCCWFWCCLSCKPSLRFRLCQHFFRLCQHVSIVCFP